MGLNVVILGAGIAGLASAIALRKKGHTVTVLESKPNLSEIGAGVQIPPNASRLLYALGLKEQLESCADTASHIVVKSYQDGSVVAQLPSESLMSPSAPSLLISRPDLQRILFEATSKAGAQVQFGVVASTKVHGDDLEIETQNEKPISPDILVIAEGIGSSSRATILDDSNIHPMVSSNAYRMLIPRESMLSKPGTAELIRSTDRQVWMAPGRTIVGYSISCGKSYNLVLEHPVPLKSGNWYECGDLDEMRAVFADFEPVVQELLSLSNESTNWALARLPKLRTWTDKSKKAVLVGDAAHATTPHLAQGAAMCIEDAVVLAECLDNASTPNDVRKATAAFEAIRKDRTEKVQDSAWQNFRSWTLPDGGERDRVVQSWRDATKRSNRDGGGKERFQDAEFREWLYKYDAVEEARNYLKRV